MSKRWIAGRLIELPYHYNRPRERAVCTSCGKDLGTVLPDEEEFLPSDEIQYCDECLEETINEDQN